MERIDYEIVCCGMFDSAVKFPDAVTTNDRTVKCYEIEYFPSDCAGTAYINGNAHKLEEGLLICAKPGQIRHSRLPFKCCYLHLRTQSPALCGLLNSLPDTLFLADGEEFAAFFYKMASRTGESLANALYVHSCTDRVLCLLSGLSANHAFCLPGAPAHAKDLLQVKKYIQNHYGEKLSLELLSEKAALSPVYFHKLFTEYYGVTPAQYTLQVRIAAAKKSLIITSDSVAEISAECGFSSQSYFNYSFKKQTGLSPLKYRKKMLSQIEV